MILNFFRIGFGLGLLSVWSFSEFSAPAQPVTNAAGIWNHLLFSAPARLIPQYNLNGTVVEIAGRLRFESQAAPITVQADGTFTGPVSGSLSHGGPGWVLATVPGEPPTAFAINTAADFGVAMKSVAGDALDLELLLKAPATMTTNDFVGTWKMVSLGTPHGLGLQKNGSGVVTEVFGRQDFYSATGTLTVAADGTFVMNSDGISTGTVQPLSNGRLQVNVVPPLPDPPFALTLYVNASRNVIVNLEAEPDYQGLDILLKQPTSTTTADLKGLWHAGSFNTPVQLTLHKNAQDEVIAMDGGDDFAIYGLAANVGHTGYFTVAPDTFGRLTVTGPGTVTVADTNVLGETGSRPVWFNSAHDVFIGTGADESLELLVATRTPPLADPAPAMGLILFPASDGLRVCWASDSNRVLQVTTNLTHWTTLPATAGQSQYALDPASASRNFYRLLQTP
jgi:hypothetical protein